MATATTTTTLLLHLQLQQKGIDWLLYFFLSFRGLQSREADAARVCQFLADSRITTRPVIANANSTLDKFDTRNFFGGVNGVHIFSSLASATTFAGNIHSGGSYISSTASGAITATDDFADEFNSAASAYCSRHIAFNVLQSDNVVSIRGQRVQAWTSTAWFNQVHHKHLCTFRQFVVIIPGAADLKKSKFYAELVFI